MTSIEKSRKSYQEIIGSFKNIHDKLEEWHKQKGSVEKGYTSLSQQQTAKFDSQPHKQDESLIEDQNQEFMYEFEKHQSYTVDSSYRKHNVKEEQIQNLSYRKTPSLIQEVEVHESDKENVSSNNFSRPQMQAKHIKYNEREQRFENEIFRPRNDAIMKIGSSIFSNQHINEVENTNDFRESESTSQSPLKERRVISN